MCYSLSLSSGVGRKVLDTLTEGQSNEYMHYGRCSANLSSFPTQNLEDNTWKLLETQLSTITVSVIKFDLKCFSQHSDLYFRGTMLGVETLFTEQNVSTSGGICGRQFFSLE